VRLFLKHSDLVVPLHEANVLLEIARERGIEPGRLLADTSITPEMLHNPDARISLIQSAQLIENALRATADPTLGLVAGQRMHIGHLGMLGTALMCQPDVRSALGVAVQFHRLFAPCWQIALDQEDGAATVRVQPTIEIKHPVFNSELLVGCLHNILSFLVGQPMRYREIKLLTPAPVYAHLYRPLTDAPITFSAENIELVFDAELLDQKLALCDELTARAAKRLCVASLSACMAHDGLVTQVRRALLASRARTPSLTEVARGLLTSPRQLRRELHSMGTSFQQLLDAVRKERAIECLVGSTMTMDELASEIGFQDARSLRRRFKHWTGTTPFAYREAHLANVRRAAMSGGGESLSEAE
jgi:AraC-like DNA-binding protein